MLLITQNVTASVSIKQQVKYLMSLHAVYSTGCSMKAHYWPRESISKRYENAWKSTKTRRGLKMD